jgi:hypothetical protein
MVSLADTMSMQVDLFISGRKLKDLDTFSKSDPLCKLFQWGNGNWVQVGMTEIKKNNLNPDFTQKITLNYFFEKVQKLKFVMIDADDNSGNGDEIGICETTLGNIMGAKQQTFTTDLIEPGKKDKRGQIIIRADSVQ